MFALQAGSCLHAVELYGVIVPYKLYHNMHFVKAHEIPTIAPEEIAGFPFNGKEFAAQKDRLTAQTYRAG